MDYIFTDFGFNSLSYFLEHGQTKSHRQMSFLYHAGGLTDHHKHGIMRLVQRTCLCFLELTSVLLTGV